MTIIIKRMTPNRDLTFGFEIWNMLDWNLELSWTAQLLGVSSFLALVSSFYRLFRYLKWALHCKNSGFGDFHFSFWMILIVGRNILNFFHNTLIERNMWKANMVSHIEWMNEWTDERRDEQTRQWTNKRMIEQINERTNELTNKQRNKQRNERTNKQANERANEQTNERTKDQTNKKMNDLTIPLRIFPKQMWWPSSQAVFARVI